MNKVKRIARAIWVAQGGIAGEFDQRWDGDEPGFVAQWAMVAHAAEVECATPDEIWGGKAE